MHPQFSAHFFSKGCVNLTRITKKCGFVKIRFLLFLSSFISMSHWSVSKSYWKRTVLLTGFHLCTSMDLFMSMPQVFEVMNSNKLWTQTKDTNENPCEQCSIKFSELKALKSTYRKEPFPCEQCHNEFSELKGLKSTYRRESISMWTMPQRI